MPRPPAPLRTCEVHHAPRRPPRDRRPAGLEPPPCATAALDGGNPRAGCRVRAISSAVGIRKKRVIGGGPDEPVPQPALHPGFGGAAPFPLLTRPFSARQSTDELGSIP